MEEKKPKKKSGMHALFLESSKSFANAAFRPLYHPMEKKRDLPLEDVKTAPTPPVEMEEKKPKKNTGGVHALLFGKLEIFRKCRFPAIVSSDGEESEIYLWKMLKRHRLLQLRWKRKSPREKYRIHALFLESSKSFANAAFRPLYHPMERARSTLWKMLKRHRSPVERKRKGPRKIQDTRTILESSKSFANAAFRPLYHPMEKRSEIYLWKMLKRHRLLQLRWKRKSPRKNTGYTHYSWKALNLSRMPPSGHCLIQWRERSEEYLWKMLKRHRLLQLRWKRESKIQDTRTILGKL
jgi:very-short-patch-repair endonuclease